MHSPFLDRAMPVATNLGLGYVQALAVLAIAVGHGIWAGEVRLAHPMAGIRCAIHRRRAWIGPLLVAIVLSGLSSDAIKGAFGRHRPWWFYQEQHKAGRFMDVSVRTVPGVDALRVHGFPSGHTATSAAMATVVTIIFWRPKRRWLVAAAWVVAGIITFSRIYLASHWPLDLVGGAALGVLSGALSVRWCTASATRRAARSAERSSGLSGQAGD